jgi:hypothetical protein
MAIVKFYFNESNISKIFTITTSKNSMGPLLQIKKESDYSIVGARFHPTPTDYPHNIETLENEWKCWADKANFPTKSNDARLDICVRLYSLLLTYCLVPQMRSLGLKTFNIMNTTAETVKKRITTAPTMKDMLSALSSKLGSARFAQLELSTMASLPNELKTIFLLSLIAPRLIAPTTHSPYGLNMIALLATLEWFYLHPPTRDTSLVVSTTAVMTSAVVIATPCDQPSYIMTNAVVDDGNTQSQHSTDMDTKVSAVPAKPISNTIAVDSKNSSSSSLDTSKPLKEEADTYTPSRQYFNTAVTAQAAQLPQEVMAYVGQGEHQWLTDFSEALQNDEKTQLVFGVMQSVFFKATDPVIQGKENIVEAQPLDDDIANMNTEYYTSSLS